VSTDKYVIDEVLFGEQYACVGGLPNIETIVDAGANIGTASLYFLNQYPNARVVAIEPDPGNFALLEANVRPYGSRCVARRAALWGRREVLSIDRGHFRDGGEWSTQVTSEPVAGAETVTGLTLPEVMADAGMSRIDLLKIDIEGAEKAILDDSFRALLDRVGTIAIELHDESSKDLFAKATAGRHGQLVRSGEVTVWSEN
jgi:FkbM family methyltransferase